MSTRVLVSFPSPHASIEPPNPLTLYSHPNRGSTDFHRQPSDECSICSPSHTNPETDRVSSIAPVDECAHADPSSIPLPGRDADTGSHACGKQCLQGPPGAKYTTISDVIHSVTPSSITCQPARLINCPSDPPALALDHEDPIATASGCDSDEGAPSSDSSSLPLVLAPDSPQPAPTLEPRIATASSNAKCSSRPFIKVDQISATRRSRSTLGPASRISRLLALKQRGLPSTNTFTSLQNMNISPPPQSDAAPTLESTNPAPPDQPSEPCPGNALPPSPAGASAEVQPSVAPLDMPSDLHHRDDHAGMAHHPSVRTAAIYNNGNITRCSIMLDTAYGKRKAGAICCENPEGLSPDSILKYVPRQSPSRTMRDLQFYGVVDKDRIVSEMLTAGYQDINYRKLFDDSEVLISRRLAVDFALQMRESKSENMSMDMIEDCSGLMTSTNYAIPISRSNWQPDKNNIECQSCLVIFSLFNRRHHCRICGSVYCQDCSSRKLQLERGELVRSCNDCYKKYSRLSPPSECGSTTDNSIAQDSTDMDAERRDSAFSSSSISSSMNELLSSTREGIAAALPDFSHSSVRNMWNTHQRPVLGLICNVVMACFRMPTSRITE
ncbi:FYVE zinc finger-domain-containing protein [Polychytrium aggregatum]|uniref:FYVE zinc finger-domain-containing protein n=1 Tax=Polychytrium aggregatum TaxID=110093 RepID=UPI0022FF1623|nr:FYVE zinc finger-domain-containing protein [Polychytrium aggregatum]KAI9203162.1 FYVE zinc finger-domain-containing protein [Polychytrium aggregatum]